MPRHSTPHEHVAATDPGPPDPPGVHVALGSEQCNGMGCAARTGLPCVNEQQMYERLLGAPVKRSTWMREAANDCTYEVKESKEKVV